jgi:ABC-type transporter Mla subunit MlaD
MSKQTPGLIQNGAELVQKTVKALLDAANKIGGAAGEALRKEAKAIQQAAENVKEWTIEKLHQFMDALEKLEDKIIDALRHVAEFAQQVGEDVENVYDQALTNLHRDLDTLRDEACKIGEALKEAGEEIGETLEQNREEMTEVLQGTLAGQFVVRVGEFIERATAKVKETVEYGIDTVANKAETLIDAVKSNDEPNARVASAKQGAAMLNSQLGDIFDVESARWNHATRQVDINVTEQAGADMAEAAMQLEAFVMELGFEPEGGKAVNVLPPSAQ